MRFQRPRSIFGFTNKVGDSLSRIRSRQENADPQNPTHALVPPTQYLKGKGLEMVITLGTGLGSALFIDGALVPNLEFGHHPFQKGQTYEDLLGKAALEKNGKEEWLRLLDQAIVLLRQTFNFDMLYIGGGNSARLDQDSFPPDVQTVRNIAGLLGGIALWYSAPGASPAGVSQASGCGEQLASAE